MKSISLSLYHFK